MEEAIELAVLYCAYCNFSSALFFRSLRSRDVTKFHVQLFIALLGMSLSFMIGIDRTNTESLCTIMSMVILYFTLASLFWMGAEAVLMFKKLVVVFGSVSTKFVISVSLVCWCKLLNNQNYQRT